MLVEKRKLTLILRPKSVSDKKLSSGDSFNVLVKNQMQKRVKWLLSGLVLSLDPIDRSVCVFESYGKKIIAAVEDVRPELKI